MNLLCSFPDNGVIYNYDLSIVFGKPIVSITMKLRQKGIAPRSNAAVGRR
jgi:hypothetical protein